MKSNQLWTCSNGAGNVFKVSAITNLLKLGNESLIHGYFYNTYVTAKKGQSLVLTQCI